MAIHFMAIYVKADEIFNSEIRVIDLMVALEVIYSNVDRVMIVTHCTSASMCVCGSGCVSRCVSIIWRK